MRSLCIAPPATRAKVRLSELQQTVLSGGLALAPTHTQPNPHLVCLQPSPCSSLTSANRSFSPSRSRAVIVLFKQTGDAPILRQNKVKVNNLLLARCRCRRCRHQFLNALFALLQISRQESFAKLVEFLRRKLGKDQVVRCISVAFTIVYSKTRYECITIWAWSWWCCFQCGPIKAFPCLTHERMIPACIVHT